MQNLAISAVLLSSNNNYIHISIDSILRIMEISDELIVVDDHSTPEIIYTLKKYAESGKITLLLSEKARNRSHNRNIGALKATNEIIVFLDGDVVLDNQAFHEVRQAYHSRAEIAFIGSVHAARYNQITLDLYSGISNFIDMLKEDCSYDQMINNPLFFDKRSNPLSDNGFRKYFWLYYYSAFCTVTKKCFLEIGGFDETFAGWGAEDVDLGYRISRQGQIGFLPDAHAIHIPHNKDILSTEYSNFINICKMQRKYNVWEIEVLATYKASLKTFDSFYNLIHQMRLLSLDQIYVPMKPNTIVINTISQEYPQGNIYYFDLDGNKKHLNGIGINLLFDIHEFDNAYISDSIFTYPKEIAARILQECMRVSRYAYLCKSSTNIRINWEKTFGIETSAQRRLFYNSADLMDYSFMENGDMLKIESKALKVYQFPSKLPITFTNELIDILKGEIKIVKKFYCALDFTSYNSSALLLQQIEQQLGLEVLVNYHVIVNIIKSPELFPTDILNLRHPFVFIVNDVYILEHEKTLLKCRSNENDIIADYNGNIFFLSDILIKS